MLFLPFKVPLPHRKYSYFYKTNCSNEKLDIKKSISDKLQSQLLQYLLFKGGNYKIYYYASLRRSGGISLCTCRSVRKQTLSDQ